MFNSVQFSRSVMSNSLQPHGPQHASLPVHHQFQEFIQSYVNWFSDDIKTSHPLSSPSSPALSLSQHQGIFKWEFFTSGGQSLAASAAASVLSMNIQCWFPLGLTGWISLPSKGLSRVFFSTTVWKPQFFSAQPSLCKFKIMWLLQAWPL